MSDLSYEDTGVSGFRVPTQGRQDAIVTLARNKGIVFFTGTISFELIFLFQIPIRMFDGNWKG